VSWLIGVGVLIVVLLCYAGWMDLNASRQGKKWVPVKDGRFKRTRFVLMDKDRWEEERRLLLYENAMADRAAARTGPRDGGYLMPKQALRRALRRPAGRS
jgi:hypothetical protein